MLILQAGGPLLWNPSTGETRWLNGLPQERRDIFDIMGVPRAGCFSPDGRRVLIGGSGGAIIWDTSTGQPCLPTLSHQPPSLRKQDGHAVVVVAYSPDGQTAFTACDDGTARLWDAGSGRPLGETLQHDGRVVSVAFSPDGQTLLTGSSFGRPTRASNEYRTDYSARFWDALNGRPIGGPLLHQGAVAGFSPDGKTAVTGGYDGTLRQWDAATGEPIGLPMVTGHASVITYSPDGRTLLTGGDGGAMLWDPSASRPPELQLHHQGSVVSADFSPDGRAALTGSTRDGTARLWDVDTGRLFYPPLKLRYDVSNVAFSPDGQTLLAWSTGSGPVNAWWWDPPGSSPNALNIGSDMLGLWSAATGRPVEPPAELRRAAEADQDGARAGPSDQQQGRKQRSLLGLTFRRDGLTLLIGSGGGKARLWDVGTGRPLGPPIDRLERIVDDVPRDPPSQNAGQSAEHVGVSYSALSPDGRTVLTFYDDGTAQLRDATTGRLLGLRLEHIANNKKSREVREEATEQPLEVREEEPRKGIMSARFRPDGGAAVTLGFDGKAAALGHC